LDQLDIVPGQRWARAVQEALNNAQRVLVILSPSSVNSTNVEDEVTFALEENKTVIPVLYRDCKIPFQLRPFQYIDFRGDYGNGLRVMLKTLLISKPSVPNAVVMAPRKNAEEFLPVLKEVPADKLEEAERRTPVNWQKLRWLAAEERTLSVAHTADKDRAHQGPKQAKAAEQAPPQSQILEPRDRVHGATASQPQTDSTLSKRILVGGLVSYAVSFALYAVMMSGESKGLLGFACAYLSLVYGVSGTVKGFLARPFLPSEAFLWISLLLSGLINPFFLSALITQRRNTLQRAFKVLRIITLSLFPLCWIFFVGDHVMPREGYFVWVSAMLLALFPSQVVWLLRRSRIK
jgi:hypothetical protein